MASESTSNGKAKLDKEGLERQGVFIFDGDSIQGDSIPQILRDGSVNTTFLRARAHFRKTDPGWNLDELCGKIPNAVCGLRELLLDCTALLPTFALENLNVQERSELPFVTIYEDEDYLNLTDLERKMARERWRKMFSECRIAATKARENIDKNVSEDARQYFMNAHLFHRYHEGRSSLLDG